MDEPIANAETKQSTPLLRVTVAVLRRFKEDALSQLASVNVVALGVEDVTWVVTILAVYDDFGKCFMCVAAHEVGIISPVDSSPLQFCLEPEAASLNIIVKDAPMLCGAGTKTTILDCAGGTVSITMQEVLPMQSLGLKEIVPPTRGPWNRPA